MAFQMKWITDEPILIVTGSGWLTVDDFKQMFTDVAHIIEGVEGKIYRIADYTTADSSFIEILKSIQLASAQMSGTSSDPRIQTIFVGTSQWISFGRTALQQPQFGGIMIPTFDNLDDALAFVRREIAKGLQETTA